MELTEPQLDALSEVVNIGVGRAAASLSELLGTRIELNVPQIQLQSKLDDRESGMAILQDFQGSVSGTALLAFPDESGRQLARLLGGFDESMELPAIELSGILSEVGNIVLNGVLGSMANMIQTDLKYRVPDFFLDRSLDSLVHHSAEHQASLIIADTNFAVHSENINGSIVLAFELGSLNSLLQKLTEPLSTN